MDLEHEIEKYTASKAVKRQYYKYKPEKKTRVRQR